MSLWEYANPRRFMAVTARVQPWVWGAAILLCGVGLTWGFFFTPEDFRMGNSVKIIYIHVPSAFIAINAWFMMLVASLIWLIRRHHVSALAACAAAPIGLIMTIVALLTGAIWGKPMWGAWWVWDARLTSELILFFFYVGYIALWDAFDDTDKAATATSYFCLVGSVFAVLAKYSVDLWNTLHQPSSMTFGTIATEEKLANEFKIPLLVMFAAFYLYFLTVWLIRVRSEIRLRRIQAIRQAAVVE